MNKLTQLENVLFPYPNLYGELVRCWHQRLRAGEWIELVYPIYHWSLDLTRKRLTQVRYNELYWWSESTNQKLELVSSQFLEWQDPRYQTLDCVRVL